MERGGPQVASMAHLDVGEALQLEIPQCQPGLGTVIHRPDASDLIAGVEIEPVDLWADDRGYFLEVARIGLGVTKGFDQRQVQVSATLSYPGIIKAFHYHRRQTDCWVAVKGMIQAALVDLRVNSPTFGCKNTMYIGTLRPWRLRIPPGVAHGYKVLGTDPAIVVYITDQYYDPEDEGRLPYNEPKIAYDWETQHR